MERIFINGVIITSDSENNIFQAMGIEDGVISFLGSNEEALERENTELVDLQGRAVTPGFIDSHLHCLNYAYMKRGVNLNGAKSISDIINLSREFMEEREIRESQWIFGRGWNQDKFENPVFPTKRDLDEISTLNPIVFKRVCGHVAVVNSRALELILSTEESGNMLELIDIENGILKENALTLASELIPAPEREEIIEMIDEVSDDLLREGITSVHSDDLKSLPVEHWSDIVDTFVELSENNQMRVKFYEQSLFRTRDEFQEFIDRGYRTGDGNEFFRIGPHKLLLDGSLGARTALLGEEYHDDLGNHGIQNFDRDEFQEFINMSQKNGFQLAVHGIGDGAISMILDSVAKSRELYPREGERHGIVHAQITSERILERMGEDNLLAYIQPIFIDYDMTIVRERVGENRATTTYAWKSMLDKGIIATGGSDAPVVGFSIMDNIYSAVTRKNLDGDLDPFLPEESLSVLEAIRLFTSAGAYASFEEEIKGTLEIGKKADIVVLSENILETESDKIKDILIDETFVNGISRYMRTEESVGGGIC